MSVARQPAASLTLPTPPDRYDADDQRAARRSIEGEFRRIGALPLAAPYYAIQDGETSVSSTAFPIGHVHRYGAVGDGVTDDLAAFTAANTSVPSGATITGIPGATYALSATPVLTKGVTMSGQGATLKALAAMAALGMSTDVSGVIWQDWNIDGNGLAQNALLSIAATVGPAAVSFLNCHAKNLATDHTLVMGGFRITGTDSTKRHLMPTIDNCSCRDSGTTGAYIYYADDAKLTNWTGYNLDNHSFEFAFCKDFVADVISSSFCGGSGAAAGAQCYHGVMSNITTNYCQGDAAITVENTSADIRVQNFMLRNCWKAGLSANYGDAGLPFPNDAMRGIHFSNGSARAAAPVTITGATKANPCKLTVPSHGIKTIYLSNTAQVSIAGVVGMTALNGTTPTVTSIDPATGIHNPNALWLVGVNSTAYGAYSSGGTIAPFCNGANMYGSVPTVAPNMGLHSIDFYDFNCGPAMLYMEQGVCNNVTVSGLQGPNSAVGRFTYFTRGGITALRNTDMNHQPNDPLGAIQFLVQVGTANGCDRVTVTDCDVLQCGATSNTPLFYTEGSGDFTFNSPVTGGASCVVSVRAADAPTIRLRNLSVALSTDTVYVLGAGATPTMLVEWPTIPRSVSASSTGVYYDGTVRFDVSSGNKTMTFPLGADHIGKRITMVRLDGSGNSLTASPTGADVIVFTTLAGAAGEKAATLEAYSGGWTVVALR